MTYSIANAVEDGQWIFDEHEAHDFWGKVSFHGGTAYEDDPIVDPRRVAGECWVWLGANDAGPNGSYGTYSFAGIKARAHRLAFRDFGGSLSDELVIDHLCRNTICVNPSHLEPTPQLENVRRGSNSFANRTHCRNGHELTPETVEHTGRSLRCTTCKRESYRRSYAKAREARAHA